MSGAKKGVSFLCSSEENRCTLCLEHLSARHTHPVKWKADMQQFLKRYSSISLDSCVCRADELSIRKGLSISNEEYIPRWVKRDMKKLKTICCVCGCKDLAKRKSALSYSEICAACNVNPADAVVAAASSTSREFYLCDRHYSAVQRYCGQESTIECALCGGKPKHIVGSMVRSPFRSIPHSETINTLLQEVGNFDHLITSDCVACNKCYLFCQKLVQQCDEDVRSSENIVLTLNSKVEELQEKLREFNNASDHNETALLRVSIHLGECMLSDKAVTFPQLYQLYCEHIRNTLTGTASPLPKYKVFVHFGREFGDLMSSVSPYKRHGRILFRTKCDPFLMLSHALGSMKCENQDVEEVVLSQQIKSIAQHLNDKVHVLSTSLVNEAQESTGIHFDLDAFINRIDSDLWDALKLLTQSCNERAGRKHKDTYIYERKIRLAYLVSVITFCASGGHCSIPLHVLLTDYIEANGGSEKVITILNRLGAVASIETLNRHIMKVSVQRVGDGLLKDLNSDCFTVATTDNIDFLQSHAAVYAGCQHRSYHATSIQVIQPQQMLKSLAGVESSIVEHVTCLNASSASVSQSKSPPSRLVSLRHERSSPIYSPSGQTC